MPPLLIRDAKRQIESLLGHAPNPDSALLYFSSFEKQHPAILQSLSDSGTGLQYLITVFSFSHFLSEDLLQHPEWLDLLVDLDRVLTPEEYRRYLRKFLNKQPDGAQDALALAIFRRRNILRILIRDVLGFATLSEITEELANLADAILEVAYQRIRQELVNKYGTPRYTTEAGNTAECGMAVIALGKLGGSELNYSSDIDLMFVYTANGETDGPNPISNKEFYKKVANQYTALLSTYTAEGLCYRVDLRLRPDGSLGEACISLDGSKKYYQTRARDWELQMLIKARAAAGDLETGRALLDFVEPLTYSTTLDFSAIEEVSATRERIHEKLSRRRGAQLSLDVKLAPGGIRDVEFLVQCLQRLHGGRVPWIRHSSTLLALARLNDKDLISSGEYSRLASAYTFLRNLEHRLQIEDDRQTHSLPTDSKSLDLIARKMPGGQIGGWTSGEGLLQELNAHLESVQEIYERVIHANRPSYYSTPPTAASLEPELFDRPPEAPSSNLVRFLDQKAPGLAAVLARAGMRQGARPLEHFLEKALAQEPLLSLLDSNSVVARYILDIIEHSPYYTEELIRTPELAFSLTEIQAPPDIASAAEIADAMELRRWFRREMFRLQAASLSVRVPVFETLERTSSVADAAIGGAYNLSLQHVLDTHPPANSAYDPGSKLMVVALGRLGMREFDLASDADLLFVIPDEDQNEQLFWTRVANRIVDILSAYTGSGSVFAVDTRLRPNGGAGALVQSESAYKTYFGRNAEAWEGIAYLKSRAVAGDTERATTFLNDLQEVDWRRYGQSGRSKKDLRQMRLRLEKEQGASHPLKAGAGGFYDIDFVLLYLRLKSAGIFFKVLNTPARIDIIEKMGHLERADAEFLRDAGVFYRAVDHAMRVYSGHSEGDLPNAEGQLSVLTDLIHRWTPEHLNHLPVKTQIAQMRARTREIFDRLFQ
ncbi:MAG TPA: hypothetical protein VKU01_03775 [Bryobacteraceae bacterium]|nr:hypothetical protein [Bryobacteraceae bacterium]